MAVPATLLVLPGLDGTDVFFRPLMALLHRSVRTVVACYPESAVYGYGDLLDNVREMASQFPQFYVLGSSFAGPLAIMLAAAEPDRVKGIILVATFVRSPRPGLTRLRFAAIGPVIWLVRAVRRIPIWVSRPRSDPFRKAKAETWSRVSARSLAARVRAILDVDARATLRECRQPILCVAYEDDEIVPRRSAEEIVQEAASAEIVSLAGRHLTMCLNPQPLVDEIVKFIAASGSACRGDGGADARRR